MQISEATLKAEQASIKAGITLTLKRKQLLSLMLASSTPLSAYELAERFAEVYDASIPAMSVYRILDFLTENNLAHKLSSENKFVSCAHATCDHAHGTPQFLICERCSKVKEIGISSEVMSSLESSVTSAGFTLKTKQLELKCLCSDCAQAEDQTK